MPPSAFGAATMADPGHPLAGPALAEALAALGQRDAAVMEATRALGRLDAGTGAGGEGRTSTPMPGTLPPYPAEYDDLRVEWERAAWRHAGDPAGEVAAKRALVRWRLHGLLGDLTGAIAHYEAAVAARPDLPTTRAALGCASWPAPGGAPRRWPHLRQAVHDRPFDAVAARALMQLLVDLGSDREQRAFARDRR